MKYQKIILLVGFLCLINSTHTFAATVTCSFMQGTTISTSGEWVAEDTDIMAIMQMFGAEGLKLKLKNEVLAKLDGKKVFFAGETQHGKVFLLGGDAGVAGKAIKVTGNKIKIYNGMCTVGFG